LSDFYIKSVEAYIKLMEILRPEDRQRGVTDQMLLGVYSRFIYPKELSQTAKSTESHDEIYAIYDSLYKFSLKRLNSFTTDAALNRLFSYYYLKEGHKRVFSCQTLNKYREAYQEAAHNLLTINQSN